MRDLVDQHRYTHGVARLAVRLVTTNNGCSSMPLPTSAPTTGVPVSVDPIDLAASHRLGRGIAARGRSCRWPVEPRCERRCRSRLRPSGLLRRWQSRHGRADFSATAQGATYWFSTEANLTALKADPAKHEPQFGGYCAYGMAKGFKPDIDPTDFKIIDDKPYLNLSPTVQTRWQEDIPGDITQATKNWSTLKSQ